MNIEYLKYFSELAKIQHYGKAAKALNNPALRKGGKGTEYFTAGTQSCDQVAGRRVRSSAVSKRRAKCEPESLWQRADEGCG